MIKIRPTFLHFHEVKHPSICLFATPFILLHSSSIREYIFMYEQWEWCYPVFILTSERSESRTDLDTANSKVLDKSSELINLAALLCPCLLLTKVFSFFSPNLFANTSSDRGCIKQSSCLFGFSHGYIFLSNLPSYFPAHHLKSIFGGVGTIYIEYPAKIC